MSSEIFMASQAPADTSKKAIPATSVLNGPTLVAVYATNDEQGLRFAMDRAARARFPGTIVRHINPRFFAAGTAPANAIAVYCRERDANVVATDAPAPKPGEELLTLRRTFESIGKAQILIVTDEEADQINTAYDAEHGATQRSVDTKIAAAIAAQYPEPPPPVASVETVSLLGTSAPPAAPAIPGAGDPSAAGAAPPIVTQTGASAPHATEDPQGAAAAAPVARGGRTQR